MNRREVLRYATYITGYAISAPLVSAIMAGCKTEPEAPPYKPVFFNDDEYRTVTVIADQMLPRTETPSASDVGVPAFIDLLLSAYYEADDVERFRTGLAAFQQEAAAGGTPFLDQEADAQLAYLNQLDADARVFMEEPPERPENVDPKDWDPTPFILKLKEMVLVGYFTSQPIGTEVLAYDPIPGDYNGCVPLSEVGKTWSLS